MQAYALTTHLRLVSAFALALALGACSRALDVTVNPYEIALPPGGTQVFQGWVSAESPLTSTALAWAADRGQIAGTGEAVTYTAPNVVGTDTVTATSRSNASQSATAAVTVTTSGARVWARQFGAGEFVFDEAHAIATDTAANVLVVGSTFGDLAGDNAGGRDAFVRMYDQDGQAVWTRQFGTSNDDAALGVTLDPSGNVLVVGEIHGRPAGGGDAFLRKYDADGTELWTQQFGSGLSDRASGVAVDAAGNVVVVGRAGGDLTGGTPRANQGGAFVRKYDAHGTELWTRQFGSGDWNNLWGVGDRASGVAVDVVGNVVVVGSTMGSVAGANLGGADAFVRMYDAGGAEGWARQFGTLDHDIATGVAVAASGRVLVVGSTFWGGSGQTRIEPSGFVRCFDAAGNELWERKFGIHHAHDDPAIAVDGSGNVLIARTAGAEGPSDSVVMKLDANGDELWSRRVGTTTNDQATTLAVDAAENVFVAGTTTYWLDTLWGGIRTDAFVWRFSP